MLKVGLTGNIGSGKTLVSRIYHAIGIPVFYADGEAKSLMIQDGTLRKRITRLIGPEAYIADQLNTRYIADVVFHNDEKLHKLNKLVHPVVHAALRDWFASLPPETPYGIEEAALLFESGGHRNMDAVIVISAPETLRIQRVMERDNVKRSDVLARMNRQMKEEEKTRLADFVIVNDGTRLLIPQIWYIHQKLLQMALQ